MTRRLRAVRAVVMRVRALFQRARMDRDLTAELDSHLAHHIDDNLRAGMDADEARRAALAKLGGIAQVEELHRDARGIPLLEHLTRDVRFGVRTLTATPSFTAVAVATLGLGIGANAAIFSVINAALFQPLPVARPAELVMVNRRESGLPTHSYPDYRDLRDRNTVLSSLVAYRFTPMNIESGGTTARIWGYLATGNYFETLGVQPHLGRVFGPDEDRVPGEHRVVVLSYGCWQRRFGADPDIVGRAAVLNGESFTVLGVMPPAFRGTELLLTPEVWVPMMMQAVIESGNEWLERRRTHNVFVLGRLQTGTSVAAAQASLNGIATEIAREHPETNEGMRVWLSPPGLVGNMFRAPVIGFTGALLAVAGLVLLLACTNLTGLLFARATDRQRETAVRLAIGATRASLIRRSLIESALLSLMGAAAALVASVWIAGALSGWAPPLSFPLTAQITIDHRVLFFCLGLAALSTMLVGLVPALHGTRTEVVPALRGDTVRPGSVWHVRDVVVGLQMVLSTLLLVGSMLVVRSLQHATHLDVGFNPRGAVSVQVDLGLQGYEQDRAREFQRRVVEELIALPGIQSATVASSLPLSFDLSTHTVFVEGRSEPRGTEIPKVPYYQVTSGFFSTLQTPIVAGRDFAATDTRESPRVAIVNQAFVSQLVGEGDPIGKRFRVGPKGQWIQIVGVARTGKYQSLGESPTPAAFHLITQWYNPSTIVVARTSLAESEAVDLVRQVVRRIDPSLPLFGDGPLTELIVLPLLPARVAGILLGAFGALAIVLVLVGTYGLMSYGIAQRTREICIRVAVGASPRHIVRLVLGRAVAVWAAAAAVGVAAALAGAPLLSPILLGVRPRDPVVIGLACGILALVTAAACWLPTRRALTTDPSALLRRG